LARITEHDPEKAKLFPEKMMLKNLKRREAAHFSADGAILAQTLEKTVGAGTQFDRYC
jgi:hypothetical protein